MANKKQPRAEETPQMPQEHSNTKKFFAALGGLLLGQVTGAVAAQASTKWGSLFSTVASGLVGGEGAAVANRNGNPLGHAAGFGMMGSAILNGLKALLGLSKNNMLRDVGSLERAVQTAPSTTSTTTNAANAANTTGTTPAALPSGQGAATTPPASGGVKEPPSSAQTTGAAPAKKTLEVKAYVEGETMRFKTPGGFVQENVIEIQEDGWIATKTGNDIHLLIDKERMAWKAEDGMVILKGHAIYNIEFASDEEKKVGVEKPFYFFDDSQGVSGFIDLDDGISGFIDLNDGISGLVDLDSGEMSGLVDLDSGDVGGLIELNDDPLDGYADPYDDDEEYDD
ncbi:hypothetical protein L6R29_18365 [Myxococcota bacterium]|nr:hypothetical protein [Myxococcota bacterium]